MAIENTRALVITKRVVLAKTKWSARFQAIFKNLNLKKTEAYVDMYFEL